MSISTVLALSAHDQVEWLCMVNCVWAPQQLVGRIAIGFVHLHLLDLVDLEQTLELLLLVFASVRRCILVVLDLLLRDDMAKQVAVVHAGWLSLLLETCDIQAV